jgi:phosphomannomutase/phosphoglucomutase
MLASKNIRRVFMAGVFKAYDVRGIFPSEVNEALFEKMGRALVEFTNARNLALGRDARLSSPKLAAAFAKGCVECGCDVTDLGLAPTPLVHFAVCSRGFDAGAVITASHNPLDYNGAKFYARGGKHLSYENGISQIEASVARGAVLRDKPPRRGALSHVDAAPAYAAAALAKNKIARGKKIEVVLDAGNGSGGPLAARCLREAGCAVVPLFCEPDGRFPNHAPDPTKSENQRDIKARVVSEEADFGVAIDGDADRAVFFDEFGDALPGDYPIAIFAQDLLEAQPGAKIIVDVKTSLAITETVREAGGEPVFSRVGHSYIHDAVQRLHAAFGGEYAGHYHFAENNASDDGIFAALRMARIISRGASLSELAAEIPKYQSVPELRARIDEDKKFVVVEEVKQSLKQKYGAERAITLDGVRLDFGDAWGLLRASNTEPLLSIRFEAKTQVRLKEIHAVFARELEARGVKLPPLEEMTKQ